MNDDKAIKLSVIQKTEDQIRKHIKELEDLMYGQDAMCCGDPAYMYGFVQGMKWVLGESDEN